MAFYESKWFLYIKNLFIGLGAGFIIIGALGKIMHASWGNIILPAAMIWEAAIFFVQAIIPPHKEYHWEKLYPGLDNPNSKVQPLIAEVGGSNATQKLDNALTKAGVNDNLINRLGDHLKTLGTNLDGLSKVTSSAKATDEFNKSASAAAASLAKVKTAYDQATNVAGQLSVATEHTKKYQEQVQAVSKNLAALNAVYELELQDSNNHLKALNKFYGNLTNAIDNLNESVEDTKKYRSQMANLANNLSTLNNIYGNMLSAMSMGGKK